jgi:hypothetical protein
MDAILDALQHLSAYRHLQTYLRANAMNSGVSWSDLRAAVRAAWSPVVEDDLLALVEELRLHGRKHVFLYRPSTEGLAALRDLAPQVDDTFSVFPLLTPDLDPTSHRLTAVRQTETHRLLVFCSHRIVRHEEPLDRQYLAEDAPEEIVNADEIKYIRRKREEAVEVVAIPLDDSGVVQIRVDLFRNSAEPSHADAAKAVRRELRRLLGLAADALAFVSPVNLAPAMESIYSDDDEGRVYELAFQCSTDARRREVMQKHDEDLRDESYHVAGMAAVGEAIDIYRLGVHWVADDVGNQLKDAFLQLPGSLALLKAEAPALYEARVPRTVREREYNYMMARLAEHVEEG